jgi:hypothetical protein
VQSAAHEPATVTVQGQPASVTAAGQFVVGVPVTGGTNTVTVAATDPLAVLADS